MKLMPFIIIGYHSVMLLLAMLDIYFGAGVK